MQKCLAYFPGVDRTVTGYEGLVAAQACLPTNDVRDHFAADYSYLARLWEALSPDPVLSAHETDHRWLTHVYESVRPSTGTGRLLWHALGPKTIELIHEHVHVDAIRDDLETLVLDADLLEAVLGAPDPGKKAKEIEIKVSRWLRKRLHDPRFKELGERLEALKERHERGLLTSVEFLKELLHLARDVVSADRTVPPATTASPSDGGAGAPAELARRTGALGRRSWLPTHRRPVASAYSPCLSRPPERMWTNAVCPRLPPRRDPAHDPARNRLDRHPR